MLLPASRFKNLLLRLVGHRIGRASTGIIPALNVEAIQVGDGASLEHLNVPRDLRAVTLSADSVIGQWNWTSAARPLVQRGAPGELWLGEKSALTSRHYPDCSGGIYIEESATVARVRGTFITHSIDIELGKQSYAPVRIGRFTLVSSNSNFTPGATVNLRSVIAMGAVVTAGAHPPERLLAGVPATERRRVWGRYFIWSRQEFDLPDEVAN
jgi:acetyltransferase-like isoleucine patch superfamily enzyme